jgi:hydrogenase maturation protein HypF
MKYRPQEDVEEALATEPAPGTVSRLAPRLRTAPIAEAVAPGADQLGLLLPYTPLHHLLLAAVGLPLVMTSANPADEPLCADNAEAIARLGRRVQGFVLHDRDIVRRLDDSVSIAMAGRPPLPLRRARGYVPAPLDVPSPAPFPILAVGGDLKSAVCLLHGQTAVLSEHLGELENPALYRNFVDRQAGVPPAELAWGFHCRLAELLAGGLVHAATEQRLDRMVLSGGCLLTRLLGGQDRP